MTQAILNATLAGRSFSATITGGTGVVAPIFNSTSPVFALWNPLGSNRLAVLTQMTICAEATAAISIAGFGFSQTLYTGANQGTAAPITVWTDGVVRCGRVGKTGGNMARIGVATTTLAAAGTFFYGLGFSQATTSLAAGLINLVHVFDDNIILEPGTLIHLVGTPASPGVPVTPTLSWYELDYTP